MSVHTIQTMISAQAGFLRNEGHTPTVLRIGRYEDEKLLGYFVKTDARGRMAGATTLNGFMYDGLSIHVTNQQTGVQVS